METLAPKPTPVASESRLIKLSANASLLCSACYAIGLSTIFFIEPSLHTGVEDRLLFIQESSRILQAWYFVIFVVFGISLITLNLGLRSRLTPSSSIPLQISFIIGLIWAVYVFACGLISIFTIEYLLTLPVENQRSAWYAIYSIQAGLGEGVEWVGGLWMIFLHLHLLQHKNEHKAFNICGLLIGSCGALTMLPSLAAAGIIFGLTQMLWFIALRPKLLSNHQDNFTYISPKLN